MQVGRISEMLKIFSMQNIQHPFETLRQKKSNLTKILGPMVRISQKFIIIFIKNLLRNTTLRGNSNA